MKGWCVPPGNPGSVSLNASYHKEQQYILFRDWVLNGFRDIRLYLYWSGWTPGGPLSVSLDVSYHKEQEYIWFRGWDLNGFCEIRPFMK